MALKKNYLKWVIAVIVIIAIVVIVDRLLNHHRATKTRENENPVQTGINK